MTTQLVLYGGSATQVRIWWYYPVSAHPSLIDTAYRSYRRRVSDANSKTTRPGKKHYPGQTIQP